MGGGEIIGGGIGVDLVNSGDITSQIGGGLTPSPVITAVPIYISATPTTNDFDELTTGKLTVWVTYIDNGQS